MCGWYVVGPIHDNFIPSLQLRILITGQPDKMFTDLRNSKGSRQLSAAWMENLIRGVNQECFEPCVFTAHVLVLGKGKTQQWHFVITPPAHNSCWDNNTLQACHTTASCSLQAVSTFTNLVLYHLALCSIILQTAMHFFLQSDLFNWYMHHHHSVVQREPLLFREI